VEVKQPQKNLLAQDIEERDYSATQIFNVDYTGLFWKCGLHAFTWQKRRALNLDVK
jgi:hypothetical protein